MKLKYLLGFTLLAGAFSINANTLDTNLSKSAPADAGVINKERILYWLEKRGEVAVNATNEEKQLALAKYLSKKSFGSKKLPSALAKKVDFAERYRTHLTRKNINLNNELKKGQLARSLLQTIPPEDVETEVNVLAVLVDFKDLKHDDNGLTASDTGMFYSAYNVEHYNDLLFSTSGFEGPTGQNIESAYQYYQHESGGKFTFDGDVQNWVTAANDAEFYGGNDEDDNDQNVASLVVEAITQLVANGLDLSDYDKTDLFDLDGDGNVNEPDGVIDHVMIFHASIGEEAGGGDLGDDAIWSHRHFVYNDDNTIVGTDIPGSSIRAFGYTINPIDAAPGVVVHEFGHDLGLPDEYDTGNSIIGEPVSDWSVMSSGSWLGSPAGTRPSAFSPYARDYLQERYQGNWINQQEIDFASLTTQNITLVSTVNHTAVNQIKVNLPAEKLPFTAPYAGDHQYYSNQGHMLDNSFSFDVDLPADNASLEMIAHWNIEKDYDFVQVLVNNIPIEGNHTSTNNQYYNGLGAYISGASSTIEGAEGELNWVPLTFDLSDFANQSITIKVRYATDQAVGEYGFVADNIVVKADGSDLLFFGGELDNEVALAGFSHISNTIDAKPHSYYVQLRSHTSVDSALSTSQYDAGVLVWYRNDNIADNKVNDHAGELFIGVVDAEQSLVKSSDNSFKSSFYQLRDAAFNYQGADKHATFSDLNDYSSPLQPESGIKLPIYGFNMSIEDQSTDSTTAEIKLTHGNSASVSTQQNGLSVSLSINDELAANDTVFTWSMGDGTSLVGAKVNHQYSAIANYQVSVSYTLNSVIETVSYDVTLGTAITGTMTTELDTSIVSFTTDIDGGEGSLNYRWDFGDNSDVTTSEMATHTYKTAGTYQVVLQIRDEINQLFELKKELVISEVASLSASFSSSINNLVVNFTSTVSGGNTQYTYAWDFGDEGSSTEQNPNHTYAQAGTYSVELTITDGADLSTVVTNSVTVSVAPVVVTPPAKVKSSGGGGGSIGFGLLFGLCLLRLTKR